MIQPIGLKSKILYQISERERERDVTAVSWIFSTVKMQAMAYDAGVSEFMIILHRQGSKVCRALPVIM